MLSTSTQDTSPDYLGLVKFLLQPLLDESDVLSLDCEHLNNKQKVWIRLAVTGDDKGKIFGRGMRNMEAVKTILQTAATAVGQSVHIELYGEQNKTIPPENRLHSRSSSHKKLPSRRPNHPKPSEKSEH
jgi:predicted RNA-binding protein YlqC (UPF0109 family)